MIDHVLPSRPIRWGRYGLLGASLVIGCAATYSANAMFAFSVLVIILSAYIFCGGVFLIGDPTIGYKVIRLRSRFQPHYRITEGAKIQLVAFAYVDGKAPNGPVETWCRENIGYVPAIYPKHRRVSYPFFVFFRSKNDAFAFKMRWG